MISLFFLKELHGSGDNNCRHSIITDFSNNCVILNPEFWFTVNEASLYLCCRPVTGTKWNGQRK